MDPSFLEEALERPDIRRKIVQGYSGAYTLGVIRLSGTEDGYAILFRVEEPNPRDVPNDIVVDGKRIPVVVRGGFRRARPLAHAG